jgi:EmrB/QacA subfamily drug resistance transporter
MSTAMTTDTSAPDAGGAAAMSHRQVLEALSGLLLGLFVTILSSTVVSTSLPRIIADLGGGQSAFTWVVTSTLLALTASTPIWGKLADLVDRKLLVQLALVLFVTGSALAGLSQSAGELIAFRVLQGLGAGGLTALSQVIMADLISPRERGRYSGYLGAVMAVGMVGGPLLGGLITDSALGWRWNFYVGVPFAVLALVVLQRTLHLPPRRRRDVSVDYPGAALIATGVSTLLIWISLAGHEFAWISRWTALLVPVAVLLLVAAGWTESRAREPILPLRLFRNRTMVLSVIASAAVGVAMFGTSVFLSQYMQLSRGKSPTASGLLTLPMVLGLLAASVGIGRVVSRTGFYKRWMLLGAVLLTAGLALMGTVRYDTSFVALSIFMALLGLGVGMLMQNLVLVVQNTVRQEDMGAASAAVAFFRSLGGAVGVAALGALLSNRVVALVTTGLAELGIPVSASGGGQIPTLSTLPAPVRAVVERSYGEGVADLFLAAAPLGLVVLVAVLLLREVPLGTRSGIEIAREEGAAASPVGTARVTAADAAGLDWEDAEPAGGAPAEPRRVIRAGSRSGDRP